MALSCMVCGGTKAKDEAGLWCLIPLLAANGKRSDDTLAADCVPCMIDILQYLPDDKKVDWPQLCRMYPKMRGQFKGFEIKQQECEAKI